MTAGGGGNYRVSIVDLLKLLDLDSSLTARIKLAKELNVNAGEHGSAEQNIALHKAVLRKLAENGGKVPGSLRGRGLPGPRDRPAILVEGVASAADAQEGEGPSSATTIYR